MKKVDKGTIIRTIVEVCALANQLVAVIGSSSFASNPVYQIVSFIITAVASGIVYWYNNDWTKLALMCGQIFELTKDGSLEEKEVEKFIEENTKKYDE